MKLLFSFFSDLNFTKFTHTLINKVRMWGNMPNEGLSHVPLEVDHVVNLQSYIYLNSKKDKRIIYK